MREINKCELLKEFDDILNPTQPNIEDSPLVTHIRTKKISAFVITNGDFRDFLLLEEFTKGVFIGNVERTYFETLEELYEAYIKIVRTYMFKH